MLAVAAAGCGGGEDAGAAQDVRGTGFSFQAPGSWTVTRSGRTVSASSGEAAVSVTQFRLARAYRPELSARVTRELDGVARELAARLRGRVSASGRTTVAGRRAWSYTFRGTRDDTRRIAFLLAGRREYQLLCRGAAEAACDLLLSTFRTDD